ncbi:hypothetical protein Taro_045812, partial [Colocasia esculenta]|nr:hypothetical protein [Colocasia esculenta]
LSRSARQKLPIAPPHPRPRGRDDGGGGRGRYLLLSVAAAANLSYYYALAACCCRCSLACCVPPVSSLSRTPRITMGRIVVESWLGRVGLLRRQLRRDPPAGTCENAGGAHEDAVSAPPAPPLAPTPVGVLALEVAGLASRVAHLWHSLADDQVARLRDDVLRLEGVRKLVSDDRGFLLALALSEMLEALGGAARAAALLGRRCSVPALQRLEHVLPEIVIAAVVGGEGTASDCALDVLQGWAFTEKKMDRKVRKMERLAAATVHLYQEMEVLAEMEQSLRRAQQGNVAGSGLSGFLHLEGMTLMDLRQKVAWQRQEVKTTRDQSLWSRSYDYVMRLLARSLFTLVVRINFVFGLHWTAPTDKGDSGARASSAFLPRSLSVAAGTTHSSSFHLSSSDAGSKAADARVFRSGPLERPRRMSKSGSLTACTKSGAIPTGVNVGGGPAQGGLPPLPRGARHSLSTKARWSVSGGPFGGCMVAGRESPVLRSCVPDKGGGGGGFGKRVKSDNTGLLHSDPRSSTQSRSGILGGAGDIVPLSLLEPKRKLLCPPPSTLGASALALHYANIIIVIEKLSVSPHLIGPEARDDLYRMLPTGVRAALRARLKPYAKNLASCLCDPVLASEWSDAVARILEWLAPLAHNMIRWQSERNYEQQHRFSRSNVLLLQTLYFANQPKTEAAIVELLVGLNYLWRFAREMNEKAMLECISHSGFQDSQDAKI